MVHASGAASSGSVSSREKSCQNYLLNIPQTATGKMGLVIVTPYAVPKERPFLESAFISYSVVLEQIRQAANENKLAVAIIGAREPLGGSAVDEGDALDVLNDIEGHYSIDSKRVYLYGVCEGGRNALLLAEHHPGIFAAVGAWGPTLAAARDVKYDPVASGKTDRGYAPHSLQRRSRQRASQFGSSCVWQNFEVFGESKRDHPDRAQCHA